MTKTFLINPDTLQRRTFDLEVDGWPEGWVDAKVFGRIERWAKRAHAERDMELKSAEVARHRAAEQAINRQKDAVWLLKRDLLVALDANSKSQKAEVQQLRQELRDAKDTARQSQNAEVRQLMQDLKASKVAERKEQKEVVEQLRQEQRDAKRLRATKLKKQKAVVKQLRQDFKRAKDEAAKTNIGEALHSANERLLEMEADKGKRSGEVQVANDLLLQMKSDEANAREELRTAKDRFREMKASNSQLSEELQVAKDRLLQAQEEETEEVQQLRQNHRAANDLWLQMVDDEGQLCQNAHADRLSRLADRRAKESAKTVKLDAAHDLDIAHRRRQRHEREEERRFRLSDRQNTGGRLNTFTNPETGESVKLRTGEEVPFGFVDGTRYQLAKQWAKAARQAEGIYNNGVAKVDVAMLHGSRLKNRIVGTKWFHNKATGEDKRLDPKGVIPEGFVPGRGNYHPTHFRQTVWVHDPETKERLRLQAGELLPTGFIPGQGAFNK